VRKSGMGDCWLSLAISSHPLRTLPAPWTLRSMIPWWAGIVAVHGTEPSVERSRD
jgi:hypothetical protein